MRPPRRVAAALTVAALALTMAGCAFRTAERDGRAALAARVDAAQQWAWTERDALAGDPEAMLTVAPWLTDLRSGPSNAPVDLADGTYVVGVARHSGHETRLDLAVVAGASSGGGWLIDEYRAATCFSLRVDAVSDSIRMNDDGCGNADGRDPTQAAFAGLEVVPVWSLGLPAVLDATTMPPDPPEALSESAHVRLLTALQEETTAAAVRASASRRSSLSRTSSSQWRRRAETSRPPSARPARATACLR